MLWDYMIVYRTSVFVLAKAAQHRAVTGVDMSAGNMQDIEDDTWGGVKRQEERRRLTVWEGGKAASSGWRHAYHLPPCFPGLLFWFHLSLPLLRPN
ncbi:hypothetical protein DPEC_G00314240 [Dallia pectoralis]|uniref:Uncharacterized protein n=1 Tax=Dallia pectoralis TaxID=75939 RepID=A0ACC2FCC5_DALPE|nr:hypothetical protein DPEC_G00314240 [Dallia pectoralis]